MSYPLNSKPRNISSYKLSIIAIVLFLDKTIYIGGEFPKGGRYFQGIRILGAKFLPHFKGGGGDQSPAGAKFMWYRRDF